MVRRAHRRTVGAVITLVVLVVGAPLLYLQLRDDDTARSPRVATPTTPISVRKEVLNLTTAERNAFVSAVRQLQTTPAPHRPSMTWYEQFVTWHRNGAKCDVAHGTAGAIHNSPLFLPWHREFLLKFEAALREVSGDPTVQIPYWDFNDPASSAAVFSADFLGGLGDPAQDGAVTTGPFAKGTYELRVFDPPQIKLGTKTPYLTRITGSTPPVLPIGPTIEALAAPQYDAAPFDATSSHHESFRQAVEGWRPKFRQPDCTDGWQGIGEMLGGPPALHVAIHGTIGGASATQSSPNDPVFWLLHANIDRLWDQWQQTHDGRFPTQAAGWTPQSEMWPWFDEPINTFDNVSDLGYRYGPSRE